MVPQPYPLLHHRNAQAFSPAYTFYLLALQKVDQKQNLSFGRTIIADFLTKKGDRRNSFALISSEAYYRREVKWHQSNELMCN